MQPEDLWHYYPVLYHIARGGSWPSIEQHGLLSSKMLLRSYGKSDGEIAMLTRARRPHWVAVDCPGRPQAMLRDQKPLTDGGLRRALRGTVEPWQWYELINSMVFFWPTKARLKTMISAAAYKGVTHDVLVVNTRALVELEEPKIRLSRMNSGCTRPFPHPRGLNLFKPFQEYPFEARRKTQGRQRAVAEVCVLDRVERIREAVRDVKSGFAHEVLDGLAC